jgi:hypothetical protein
MAISLVLQFLLFPASPQGGDTGLIEEFDASLPRTGKVTLMMSPSQLLGPETAAELNHLLLSDEMIEWSVYVPDHYSPQRPPGVIVFVPSLSRGALPDNWRTLMDEKNLIWMGARDGGASEPSKERVLKAILAPYAIADRYAVNRDRVYIAGYSDGGKVANLVQVADPVMFSGGLYICGALFWRGEDPGKFDKVVENRHVFIGGCADTDKREVIRAHEEFLEAGVANARLLTMQAPRGWLPRPATMEQAIEFLDDARPNPQIIDDEDE